MHKNVHHSIIIYSSKVVEATQMPNKRGVSGNYGTQWNNTTIKCISKLAAAQKIHELYDNNHSKIYT